MNWNAAMEDNRRVLKRIVALLYAFAALAERASTRHYLLRASVLWILRSAETIARDFVMDMALENGASVTSAALVAFHRGDSPADAMRLAESFRALALLLDRLTDGNFSYREIGIRKLCIELTAYAAGLSGTRFDRRQPSLAPPEFAIDSS